MYYLYRKFKNAEMENIFEILFDMDAFMINIDVLKWIHNKTDILIVDSTKLLFGIYSKSFHDWTIQVSFETFLESTKLL
jgi:hypothetical protein